MDPQFALRAHPLMQSIDCVCRTCRDPSQEPNCTQKERRQDHVQEVNDLLAGSSDITFILVGDAGVKLSCHTAVLAFFSCFFENDICYGKGFRVIPLPQASVVEIRAFITWCYTGRLASSEQLWVLGNFLESAKFVDETMFYMFNLYGKNMLNAAAAHYAYTHTEPGYYLRLFVLDLIKHLGPLSSRSDTHEKYRPNWRKLIRAGGDLVLDMINGEGSFRNWRREMTESPCYHENIYEYIDAFSEDEEVKDVAVFLRETTQRKGYLGTGLVQAISRENGMDHGIVASTA